ncbi:hypothetical protein PPACK8108_LOCUS10187 [Phakopsora pachyrhizi]|uniref:Uncharacterized protein n=1 Tax=Phakopsora pachyrhizi TaxID=170000 RepID=A0AAV0B0I4_PHAPC|nr:hypothetical protein PPACK8108_LOCUS10187 [Phakopsora pachyrhizi]
MPLDLCVLKVIIVSRHPRKHFIFLNTTRPSLMVNSRRFVVNMEQNNKASTLASASIDTNLSSSALNKGLSLALERKFSKSPCRTPPSRTTASETNLSVPAANFSHLQVLSNSGSALSEGAFDDSENLSAKGENQNLSRKSRIKRQVSATIDPTQAGTYQQWSSMISLRDGYTSASKTNNIEADSIRALQETNVAIQKATSKRLSTLEFQKPVSIHLQTALAELISFLTGNGKDDMNSKQFPLQSEPEDES